MGLFNKKEDIPELQSAPSLPKLQQSHQLPELPQLEEKELPRIPDIPKSFPTKKPGINELPSLPMGNDSLNQEMVKSAIADTEEEEDEEELTEMEIPEFKPIRPIEEKEQPAENKPIFIRIDKFQSAQKEFETMKRQIKEIDSSITKMKTLIEKENEELKEWESNIEKMKSKFSTIDSTIFDKT